jgi:predicted transcriptional regulator
MTPITNMLEEELKNLGFTDNEVSVYLTILKIGETPVGGIVQELRIHRQVIYYALDSLEKKQLITRIEKNKIAHFKLSDPELLVENVKKQELIAKRASKLIKDEHKKSKRENEISVFNGQRNIQDYFLHRFEETPIGGEFYTLGSLAKRYEEIMGEKFLYGDYDRLRKKRKIKSRHLMNELFRKQYQKLEKRFNKSLRNVRYLPYRSLSPTSTLIWKDRVTFLSSGSEVFLIEVKNQEFRESHKEHFDLLWKIAKK